MTGFNGAFCDSQNLSGVGDGQLLQMPEHEHIPVGFRKFRESLPDAFAGFSMRSPFAGRKPPVNQLLTKSLKRLVGNRAILILFSGHGSSLALYVLPMKVDQVCPSEQPRVKRNRTGLQVVFPLAEALGQCLLNDVRGVKTLAKPTIETDFDHPPQFGPVALEEFLRRFQLTGFRPLEQLIGVRILNGNQG